MPRTSFEHLPETARLWIFAAERALAQPEAEQLLGEVDAFLDQWAAHGVPLTAAREWRDDRFLLVGVDEEAAGVSGCSIDALVGRMKELERTLRVALVDHGPVLYRDNGSIRRVSRERFAELASAGSVGPETVVYNNTLTKVGELRTGRWEVAAKDSWHGRAFF